MKRVLFSIVTVIEIIALVVVFVFFYTRRDEYSFSGDELEIGKTYQSTVAGHYIGKETDGSSRSVSTPQIMLNNGIYNVEINYDAGGYVNGLRNPSAWSVAADVENQADYTVDSDNNRIPQYSNVLKYRFYVHEHNTGVSIKNYLSDDTEGYIDVHKITVRYENGRTSLYFLIQMIFWMLLFDGVLFCLLFYKGRFIRWAARYSAYFSFAACLVFILEIPMMMNYLYNSDDLLFHCFRIKAIADGLESGLFPVKIQPSWMNGYGYATGVFYNDIFLYFPAVLYICGFPMHFCYKLYVLLINCLTVGTSCYAAVKMSNNRFIAYCCCTVYSLSLFRLCDLYTRGALGEYTAMAFLPLICLGFWKIYYKSAPDGKASADPCDSGEKESNGWICLSLGAAGIIGSHILTTMLTAVFCVIFLLLMWKKTFQKTVIMQLLKAFFATIILNLYYIIPLLDYYLHHKLLVQDITGDIEDQTVFLSGIFSTIDDIYDKNGVMLLSLGFSGMIILAVAVFLLLRNAFGRLEYLMGCLLLISIVSVWISSNLFPYRFVSIHMPKLYHAFEVLQYPWRIFTITELLIYVIAIFVSKYAYEKYDRNLITAIMCMFCIIAGYQALNFSSEYLYQNKNMDGLKETLVDMTDTFPGQRGEYILQNTDIDKLQNNDLQVSDTKSISADVVRRNGLSIYTDVTNNTDSNGYIDYPLMNYRGYQARNSEGKALSVINGDNNRVRVIIPSHYQGSVHVYFAEPWYWRASELISLVFMVLFAIYTRTQRRCNFEKE